MWSRSRNPSRSKSKHSKLEDFARRRCPKLPVKNKDMKIIRLLVIASAAVLVMACGPRLEGSPEVQALHPNKARVDSASYLLGVNFGSMIKGYGFGELDYDLMVKGMKDFMKAKGDGRDSAFVKQFKIDPNAMNTFMDEYLQQRRAYVNALNDEKGRAFIEKFLQEEGAQKTESGLAYKILEPGSEVRPASKQDTVWVNYRGTNIDGSEFDKGEGIQFVLGGVISGWTEGMQLIGEGGKIKLVIPAELAYGERANRGIEPNSTLVFDVELQKVRPFVEPED